MRHVDGRVMREVGARPAQHVVGVQLADEVHVGGGRRLMSIEIADEVSERREPFVRRQPAEVGAEVDHPHA